MSVVQHQVWIRSVVFPRGKKKHNISVSNLAAKIIGRKYQFLCRDDSKYIIDLLPDIAMKPFVSISHPVARGARRGRELVARPINFACGNANHLIKLKLRAIL